MKFIRPLSQTTLISDANLVSYWPLDGNANDYKNVNNGTSTAVIYGGQYAQFGQGGYFNGNSSYIDVGNNASLQLGAGPFTISAWFKKAANGTVGSIYHDNAGTSNYYSIGTNSNNTLFLYVAGDSGYTVLVSTTSTITDTNWHLLTCVIESSTSRKIYLDGVLNVTNTTNIVGSISSNRTKNIGRNTSNVEYFNGSIDDVSIFNRALTATEVAYLAAGETFINNRPLADTRFFTDSGLKGYWKLDGNSTDSKSTNNGTDTAITYGTQYGAFGQGASFNGSTSKIYLSSVTPDPYNFIQNTLTFTISAWIKLNDLTARQAIFANSSTGANPGYLFMWETYGSGYGAKALRIATYYGGSAKIDCHSDDGATINDLNWHHVVVTGGGAGNYITFYVDGVKKTTTYQTSYNGLGSGNSTLLPSIGAETSGFGFINGNMDDISVFNRALSYTEVQELYEKEVVRAIYRPLEQTRFRNDDNLVAYWKLDGNAIDSKGGYNGTGSNIVYVNGGFNQSVLFNGTNSIINLPALGLSGSIARSFSCWVKPNNITAGMTLYYSGLDSTTPYGQRFGIFLNGTNNGSVYVGSYGNDGYTAANAVTAGVWNHVVVTYDGTGALSDTTVKVYVNAKIYSTSGYGTAFAVATANSNYAIGGNYAAFSYMDGLIEDVALFSRVLSREEVAELYQSQTVGEIEPLSYKPQGGLYATSLINDANLVSYWKMDGNSRDSKGTNHGTDTAMTYGSAYGKFGQGGYFNGSSSQILTGLNPSTTLGQKFSISVWFYSTSVTNYKGIVGGHGGSSQGIIMQQYSTGIMNAGYGNGSTWVYVSSPISANMWNHIVFVVDVPNTIYLYLNGILVSSAAATTNVSHLTTLWIGKDYESSDRFFQGNIDDVSIFNRALSAAEVFEIYSKGESSPLRPLDVVPDLRQDANLLSYWKLNGDAIDSKGTKNGTASNVTYTTGVNGRFGQSGLFNGSSSRITASLATTAADNFTVSVWVNPANLSQLGTFVCNGGDSGVGCDGWWIGIGNGSGGAGAMLQALCPCVAWINTGYTFPSANTWYHVVMVRRSGTMYFFINGTQQSTTSATAPITPATETSIGGLSGARYFNGKLDDITIFNRALTNAEIYQLYTQGSTLGYWKLNGSSTDYSGNGNHGTDTAITYAQGNGVFNQGALFNGTSSLIQLPNNASLRVGAAFTLSAWFKTSSNSGYQYIIGKSNFATDLFGYEFFLYLDTIKFYVNGATVGNYLVANQIYNDNTWHHVVGVATGTNMYIYFDSKLIGTMVQTQIPSYTTEYNGYIGAEWNTNYAAPRHWFNGLIDEVIIENRAWSAVEVKKYYTSKSPARIALPTTSIPTSGLVMNLDAGNAASYPGSGTVWTDLSPSALTFNSAGTFPTYEVKNGYPSFAFNGSGYWYCGTNYGLVDLGGDFTLILWLFGEDVTTRKTIFEKAGTSYNSYEQELAMTWEVDESMSYYSRYSPAYDYGSAPAGTMPTNGWIMFSLKISSGKTSAARVGSWSKNGSNWTEAYTSRSSTAVLASGQIRIGTGYAGTMDNGNVAMAIAYNRLLSNAEISQIYVATASKFVM